MPALDQLSTSQTKPRLCPYGAPLAAIANEGVNRIMQTCCNHWECPVCGETRARQEYRRIVNGCEVLGASHPLYFWTLTCRGKEIPLDLAEDRYYEWTNRLLSNARSKAQRALAYWCYVQVTERQKKTRRHPHSHLITTFLPDDAQVSRDQAGLEGYVSAWFARANATAGLGSQHRITRVTEPAAVSRYVAKYMFKDSMIEKFPPKWKRVRYSQNFPKLPLVVPEVCITLDSRQAWKRAAETPIMWVAENEVIYSIAWHRLANVRPVYA